ncbi:MAG: PfkB family carbohydrate kinase [Gemmatimonadaceae bacterium]|jgi:fructokinase|nr:PfkB family carbohydrate kinase [Gemmatimonadaceae bacterium]
MTHRIVGIGELLWDVLPSGPQLGGATANVAFHAAGLGARAAIVSRVGQDALGERAVMTLRRAHVETACVGRDAEAPTGTVSVSVDAAGQPGYAIAEQVAWDRLVIDADAQRLVSSADAVCFGTLAQRATTSRHAIQSLVGETAPAALRVFDVNLRQHYWTPDVLEQSLVLANVLKVNEEELPVLARTFGLEGSVLDQLDTLMDRWSLWAVALTRGARGSVLLDVRGAVEHPGLAVTVGDAVGAGDAFTAALMLGLLAEWEPTEINARANAVAAAVASQRGAMVPLPDDVRTPFLELS